MGSYLSLIAFAISSVHVLIAGSAPVSTKIPAAVTFYALEIVNLAPITSNTTTFLVQEEGCFEVQKIQSNTGRAEIQLKPDVQYNVTYENPSVFEEWLLVRYEKDGENIEWRDVHDSISWITIGEEHKSIYLIKIPNDWVGIENHLGRETTKLDLQAHYSARRGLWKFPRCEIHERYRTLSTEWPDTDIRRHREEFIQIFNSMSRRYHITPHDGGELPRDNYIDVDNVPGPNNGVGPDIVKPKARRSTIHLGGTIGVFADVLAEEYLEARSGGNGGFGTTVSRAFWFKQVNVITGPEISFPEFNRYGLVCFYIAEEGPTGWRFK